MVKPDVKHNYYSDLDLPTNASIDDIRKAYRKLALQFHPDRNAGNEDECVPRFQAIQAANEVLSDPTIKAKYDQDRRKAGLYPSYKTGGATPGNPYQATSNYPPPPRRTQPGTWQRPNPPGSYGPTPTGADRFTNFPKPANAMPRKDPAADRTQQFRAWQNMNSGPPPAPDGRPRPPNPGPPPPPRSPNPQAAANSNRPRMSRQDTKMPTEEQIRAGMRHGKAHTAGDAPPAADKQSAWQAFQTANAGKPGVGRGKSTRAAPNTPKRAGGFDPNAPGSDERPAPQSTGHYMNRQRTHGFGDDGYPPPPPGPPPPSAPTSPMDGSHRPFGHPLRPSMSRGHTEEEVPYTEANRNRAPYSSFIGEKTRFDSDGLRRSASTRDTTRLNPESNNPSASRARSNSPVGRQKQGEAGRGNGAEAKSRVPGMYSDSSQTSSASSDFDPDDPDGTAEQDHGRGTDATPSKASPFPAPDQRPKKRPMPPSAKLGGSNASSNATSPAADDASATGAQSESGAPSMEQRKASNMYATPSFSPTATPSFSRGTWVANAFGPLSKGGRHRDSAIPNWAIPSTVSPTSHIKDRPKAFAAVDEFELSEQAWKRVTADPLWSGAASDVRSAYLIFRGKLRRLYGEAEELNQLDLNMFLKLVMTTQHGQSTGHAICDDYIRQAISRYPSIAYMSFFEKLTDNRSSANSFSFPINHDTFTSSAGKSRSVEDINTQFSPEGWAGAFKGSADYFAATGRRHSPAGRRARSTHHGRSATANVPTSNGNTPGAMDPPPRPGFKEPLSVFGSPTDLKFSEEQWKNTFKDASWTWPPPPPNPPAEAVKSGMRSKTPSRKSSRLRSGSHATGTKEQPHVIVDDDDNGDAATTEAKDAPSATNGPVPADDGDAMDIDTPLRPATEASEQEGGLAGSPKEPRLYSVPLSDWRKQQERQRTAHQKSASDSLGKPPATQPNLNANLDDLTHVEPLAATQEGLQNLSDMSSTLPFHSQAATTTSPTSGSPRKLQMPPVPKIPKAPNTLSKASWHAYALSMATYLQHYHAFNKTMLAHFDAREKQAEARMLGGTAWLQATGDTHDKLGFDSYFKGVREDEQVRETWNIGCEKHLEAMKNFEQIRERVRKLAAQGALKET